MVQDFITLLCADVEGNTDIPTQWGCTPFETTRFSQGRQQGLSGGGKASQTAWGENTSDAHNCNSSGKHHEVITRKRLKMSG